MLFRLKKKKQEINLLPEAESFQTLSKTPFVISATIILIMIAAVGATFAFGFWQKKAVSQLENEIAKIEAEGKKEVFKTAQLFAQTKKILADYQNFVKDYPDSSQKLAVLEKIVPVSVQLTQVSIENSGKASLGGQAADPNTINDFVAALQNDSTNFKDVNVASVSKEQGKYKFAVNFYFK